MDDDDFLRNHWIMYFKYDRKKSESYARFLLNDKFTAKNAMTETITLDDVKNYIDSLGKSIKSWFYNYLIQSIQVTLMKQKNGFKIKPYRKKCISAFNNGKHDKIK